MNGINGRVSKHFVKTVRGARDSGRGGVFFEPFGVSVAESQCLDIGVSLIDLSETASEAKAQKGDIEFGHFVVGLSVKMPRKRTSGDSGSKSCSSSASK